MSENTVAQEATTGMDLHRKAMFDDREAFVRAIEAHLDASWSKPTAASWGSGARTVAI